MLINVSGSCVLFLFITGFDVTLTGPVTVCPVLPASSSDVASWVFIPEGDEQDTTGVYDLDMLGDLRTFARDGTNFCGFEDQSVLSIIIRDSTLTSGSVSVSYTSQARRTVTLLLNYG